MPRISTCFFRIMLLLLHDAEIYLFVRRLIKAIYLSIYLSFSYRAADCFNSLLYLFIYLFNLSHTFYYLVISELCNPYYPLNDSLSVQIFHVSYMVVVTNKSFHLNKKKFCFAIVLSFYCSSCFTFIYFRFSFVNFITVFKQMVHQIGNIFYPVPSA